MINHMFTGYFTYGIAEAKITYRAISQLRAEKPIKIYWKIKDITTSTIIYEGWSTGGNVFGVIGHDYQIAALNDDNSWAKVTPMSFKLSGRINVVAVGKESTPQPTTCKIRITSNVPLIMTYRDSQNNKETTPSKVTLWEPNVACGAVRVAALDELNNYASISPSDTQNVSPGVITSFVAISSPGETQACVKIQNCGSGCLSLCGNTPTAWSIRSYSNANLNLQGSGTTSTYPGLEPGWYYIIFSGAGSVKATPNPFEIKPNKQTSVAFFYSEEPQTVPPTYPYLPTSSTSYIPNDYSTATIASETPSTLETFWDNYWQYILGAMGVTGLITYLAMRKKK